MRRHFVRIRFSQFHLMVKSSWTLRPQGLRAPLKVCFKSLKDLEARHSLRAESKVRSQLTELARDRLVRNQASLIVVSTVGVKAHVLCV